MNTRDIAKHILCECMDELSKMCTYVDTDTVHLLPISFEMHVLAYDYIMKGEY